MMKYLASVWERGAEAINLTHHGVTQIPRELWQ